MAYTKLNLKTGDLVTAEVFAHLEDALDTNNTAITTNKTSITNVKKVADAAAPKTDLDAVKKTADAAAKQSDLDAVKKTADAAAPKTHRHVAADITDLEAYVDARIAAAAAAASG